MNTLHASRHVVDDYAKFWNVALWTLKITMVFHRPCMLLTCWTYVKLDPGQIQNPQQNWVAKIPQKNPNNQGFFCAQFTIAPATRFLSPHVAATQTPSSNVRTLVFSKNRYLSGISITSCKFPIHDLMFEWIWPMMSSVSVCQSIAYKMSTNQNLAFNNYLRKTLSSLPDPEYEWWCQALQYHCVVLRMRKQSISKCLHVFDVVRSHLECAPIVELIKLHPGWTKNCRKISMLLLMKLDEVLVPDSMGHLVVYLLGLSGALKDPLWTELLWLVLPPVFLIDLPWSLNTCSAVAW